MTGSPASFYFLFTRSFSFFLITGQMRTSQVQANTVGWRTIACRTKNGLQGIYQLLFATLCVCHLLKKKSTQIRGLLRHELYSREILKIPTFLKNSNTMRPLPPSVEVFWREAHDPARRTNNWHFDRASATHCAFVGGVLFSSWWITRWAV